MNMSEKIKYHRQKKGLTLEELGNRVGVSKSTVRKWEVGLIENMRRDKIAKIATALNISPSYLMGWTEDEHGKDKDTSNIIRVPVYGNVAAGIPIEMIEDICDFEELNIADYPSGSYFGLKIKGDSMEPRILNGDTVIVREQPDAESGAVVIAAINGDSATCKRLKKYHDGIELISLNHSYEPLFFSNEEVEKLPVRIIGVVVELRGKP